MMDFDNVLSIATQNRGDSNVQKRYSLQTGPPKKDPKSKGVNPAAIQALLKKQQVEHKIKVTEMKKQKEELLAKRVELKSDRKARAMASRTKDNFKGYNGIPIVEAPKKRRTKQEMEEERAKSDTFRNGVIDLEDDEDNYEYEQSDSEEEEEPQRNTSTSSNFKSPMKPSVAPKSSPLNFADLLKLAEKKQHEPVELKPKIVKKEERLRTAEEIRELELERKAKKLDVRGEKPLKDRISSSSSNSTKSTLEKSNKLQKPMLSGSSDKQLHKREGNVKTNSSSKMNGRDKERDRVKPNFSGLNNNKMSSRPTDSQVSAKHIGTKMSSSLKSTASNGINDKKDKSLSNTEKSMGSLGSRPSSSGLTSQKNLPQKREQQRPGTNSTVKSNVLPKPGSSNSSNHQVRPGGPPQMKSGVRPGVSAVRTQSVGQSRPGNGPTPGRATGSVAGGSGAPRCTVVSETISSKNVVGAKPGVPSRPGMGQQRPGMGQQRPEMGQQRPGIPQQRPGMGQQRPGTPQQRPGMGQQRPGMGQQRPGMAPQRPGVPQQRPGVPQQRPGMPQQRPGMGQQRPGMGQQRPMNRPPGPMLPPITSAYKRKYEEEEDEYDSEMDDFIDDGGDEQEEISRHIKDILAMIETDTKTKVTMHYDLWKAVGKICKRRRQEGECPHNLYYLKYLSLLNTLLFFPHKLENGCTGRS
ncbi:hypothetical protein WMY93_023697 [Mugilogobius chulae]|uniref:SPT2 homolog N-terminal domain-containing protein n=1 Tax=Mugilogobius chulae TaxID=88201 RepID=A0AAW0N4Z0_9GOBI